MTGAVLLDVAGLSVKYGQLEALRGVDLQVSTGDVVFIAGPNGAGKSTLLRAIAGDLRSFRGSITFAGHAITNAAPESIATRGLTLVPEGREIFHSLSVAENLGIGAYRHRDRASVAAQTEFVLDELPELKPMLGKQAGLLSGGQQQMLSIGRALMTKASLMAIDEPSLGLAPKVIDRIYEVLMRLRSLRGLSFLIAEQSFARAVQINARLVILRTGSIAQSGFARQLAADGMIERAYFGY